MKQSNLISQKIYIMVVLVLTNNYDIIIAMATFDRLFNPTEKGASRHHQLSTFNPYNRPINLKYCNNNTPYPSIQTEQLSAFQWDPFLNDGDESEWPHKTVRRVDRLVHSHEVISDPVHPEFFILHFQAIVDSRAINAQMLQVFNVAIPTYQDNWLTVRRQFKTVLKKRITELNQYQSGWRPTHFLYRRCINKQTHAQRIIILKEMLDMVAQEEQVKALLHACNKKENPLLSDLAKITAQFAGALPPKKFL